jgi:poly-gamma-glutamate capsule biosynthesis protein CapA/YwtB (metallophosphatase superfamily)
MLLWENKNTQVLFRIAVAGDYLPDAGLHPSGGCDWESFSSTLDPYFERVNLTILNLECPLDVGSGRARPKFGLGDSFAASSASLGYLSHLRAQIVGIANNHVYDYGAEGLEHTRIAIANRGMIPLGSGRSLQESPDIYVAKTPFGVRIGFWAAASNLPELATRNKQGVEPATASRARDAISELRFLGTRLNIALLHTGMEHTNRPAPNDVALLDDFVKLGFDVVAASHSHRISGYRSVIGKDGRPGFSFYGLGSLSSGIRYSTLEHEGILIVIGLDVAGDIARIEAKPIQLSKDGWGMVPEPGRARETLDRFLMLSKEIEDGSYRKYFYQDTGKDLFHRQFRNLQAAYQKGGVFGVARVLSRLRIRHVNRVLNRGLGS